MAALPPTAGGPSDQLPDTHSPSRSVKSASATAPDLAAAKVARGGAPGGGGDGPMELSKALPPPRLDDDMRAMSEGGERRRAHRSGSGKTGEG